MPHITATTTVAQDRADFLHALLVKLGSPVPATYPDGKVMLQADGSLNTKRPSRRAMSLATQPILDIAREYYHTTGPTRLQREVRSWPAMKMARFCLSRATQASYYPNLPPTTRVALSGGATGDYPGLLADSMGKAMLAHFSGARKVWKAFAREGIMPDYKEGDRVRLADFAALDELAPGGAVTYEAPAEADTGRERLKLATYSGGVAFTRQALINDDTQGIGALIASMAQAANRVEDRLAFASLTDNPTLSDSNALFSTAHANTISGGITVTNIATAAAAISIRTDSRGRALDLEPAVLLVPAALRMTAEQTLASFRVSGDERVNMSSPPLRVASSGVLDETSASQWYLTTNPNQVAAVEVAFLAGEREPVIDQASDFDHDGLKVKVRHSVASTPLDYRGVVRSSGA